MIGRAALFYFQFRSCGFPVSGYVQRKMSGEEPTIEAEVVSIDGIPVEPRPAKQGDPTRVRWNDWGRWQGSVKKLDARWLPLWLVLGFILLVLVVAIGMCVAVLAVTYWIFKSILVGIASLLMPSRELQRR